MRVWQTGGGNNSRRGWFGGAAKPTSRPARQLAARGAVQASVVFSGENAAFVADMAGWVQAFAPDGKPLWEQQLQGGISATPALDSETSRLFVGTHRGWAYAIDAASGSIHWKTEIPTESDPRILSDLLYLPRRKVVFLSSWGGRFHALAAADGARQFSCDAGISPCAGAAADRLENIYALRAVRDEGIHFLHLSPDGKETILYRQTETQRPAHRLVVAAPPVLDEARQVAYFVTNTGKASLLHAWHLQEQKILWSLPFSNSIQATPAILPDGTIVVADLAGEVHAAAPDGSRRYRYQSGGDYLLAGPVCEQESTVMIGDPLGRVHVLGADGSGQPTMEVPRSIQARLSFDSLGNLYVPCTDRQVYVYPNRLSL